MADAGRIFISVESDFDKFDREFKTQTAKAEREAQRTGQTIGRNMGDAIKRELEAVAKAASMIGLAFLAIEFGTSAAKFGIAAMKNDVMAMEQAVKELPFGLSRFGELALDIRDNILSRSEIGQLALAVSRSDLTPEGNARRQQQAMDEFWRKQALAAQIDSDFKEEEYKKRIAEQERIEKEAEARRRKNISDSIQYQMEEYERAFEQQVQREEAIRKASVDDRMASLRAEIDGMQPGAASDFVTRSQTAIGTFGFGQDGAAEGILEANKRIETLTQELVRLQREEVELARARQMEGFR